MAEFGSFKDMDTKRINEEYKIWKKNVCFMYDYIITHSMDWPTLSLDFYPSPDSPHEDYYIEHILTSTYTGGKEQERLLVTECKVAAEVRDLGINNTVAKKRGKKEHSIRCGKGERRATRTKWMTRTYGKAKQIFCTGAMAQMSYQAKAIGATKGEIRRMRGAAAEAAGGGRRGRCSTTKLALSYGAKQDPAVRIRRVLVK